MGHRFLAPFTDFKCSGEPLFPHARGGVKQKMIFIFNKRTTLEEKKGYILRLLASVTGPVTIYNLSYLNGLLVIVSDTPASGSLRDEYQIIRVDTMKNESAGARLESTGRTHTDRHMPCT